MVQKIKIFFEQNAFGVCTRLAEKMGISTESVRIFFIYASFITLGSPVIVYLGVAFIIEMQRHFRKAYQIIRGY